MNIPKILTCDDFETTAKMWRLIVPSQILGLKLGNDFPIGNIVTFAMVEALKKNNIYMYRNVRYFLYRSIE
jgi:hypothetical protein